MSSFSVADACQELSSRYHFPLLQGPLSCGRYQDLIGRTRAAPELASTWELPPFQLFEHGVRKPVAFSTVIEILNLGADFDTNQRDIFAQGAPVSLRPSRQNLARRAAGAAKRSRQPRNSVAVPRSFRTELTLGGSQHVEIDVGDTGWDPDRSLALNYERYGTRGER